MEQPNFFSKPFDDINIQDLQSLIDSKVSEKKVIEYKLKLPERHDKKIAEFLADVSSFANASGGYIFYGINEEEGFPIELSGLEDIDQDGEINRLENLIRTGISPRIPGITVRSIIIENNKCVIGLHIPKSWLLPHMVTHSEDCRFFSRHSVGKYRLDVGELRSIFLLSDTLSKKVKEFQRDRLSAIISDEIPVLLREKARIILHIIPANAFNSSESPDLSQLIKYISLGSPIGTDNANFARYNVDGCLITSIDSEDPTKRHSNYLQFYRNFIIESVDSGILSHYKKDTLPSDPFEYQILRSVKNYIQLYSLFQLNPPYIVLLSLIGVNGFRIEANPSRYPWASKGLPIDRDTLILPDILIEDISESLSAKFIPVFDTVWNAAGWPGSKNYDQDGKWLFEKELSK